MLNSTRFSFVFCLLAGVLLLSAMAGCPPVVQQARTFTQTDTVVTDDGSITIHVTKQDEAILLSFKQTIEKAMKHVTIWGKFSNPIHIWVLPDHQALENYSVFGYSCICMESSEHILIFHLVTVTTSLAQRSSAWTRDPRRQVELDR